LTPIIDNIFFWIHTGLLRQKVEKESSLNKSSFKTLSRFSSIPNSIFKKETSMKKILLVATQETANEAKKKLNGDRYEYLIATNLEDTKNIIQNVPIDGVLVASIINECTFVMTTAVVFMCIGQILSTNKTIPVAIVYNAKSWSTLWQYAEVFVNQMPDLYPTAKIAPVPLADNWKEGLENLEEIMK
jgi:hypothetical protein